MIGKIHDHLLDRSAYLDLSIEINQPPSDVYLGQREGWKGDLFIVLEQGLILENDFGLKRDFIGIGCQNALIKAFDRRQWRLVAKEQLDEVQALNMAAQHHEARSNRRRKEQAGRPPNQGPERRRHDNSEWR